MMFEIAKLGTLELQMLHFQAIVPSSVLSVLAFYVVNLFGEIK
jgi:Na+/pantothenate symporter